MKINATLVPFSSTVGGGVMLHDPAGRCIGLVHVLNQPSGDPEYRKAVDGWLYNAISNHAAPFPVEPGQKGHQHGSAPGPAFHGDVGKPKTYDPGEKPDMAADVARRHHDQARRQPVEPENLPDDGDQPGTPIAPPENKLDV